MALNMFRAVFLCVMFTVAQSQMSNNCLKVTTTYAGCDGMKLSTNGCFPAGATSSMVDPILKVNATAECSIMQRDWCPTFGGTANKDSDFCTTGYCNYRKGIHLYSAKLNLTCSTNADCDFRRSTPSLVVYIADYKKLLGQMCKGLKFVDETVIF